MHKLVTDQEETVGAEIVRTPPTAHFHRNFAAEQIVRFDSHCSSSAVYVMSAILGYLFLGGKADAKDKAKLQKLKIKYILNCTPPRTQDPENGCSNFYEKEKAFVYKRIPIFDNKGEDIMSHLKTAFDFIEEGKHYGNVLVHCHKGISRSASFVIGYLMRKNEFTFDEALAHVQSCRPIVQPNTSFVAQLLTYQPNGVSTNQPSEESSGSVGPELGPQLGPSIGSITKDEASLSQEEIASAAEREGANFDVQLKIGSAVDANLEQIKTPTSAVEQRFSEHDPAGAEEEVEEKETKRARLI
jgi:hypothetical protein